MSVCEGKYVFILLIYYLLPVNHALVIYFLLLGDKAVEEVMSFHRDI
jgi:hypothetical protein